MSRATHSSADAGSVALASAAALVTKGSFASPLLVDGRSDGALEGSVSDGLRRDVIGVSNLWKQAGIAVLTHPFCVVIHAASRRVAPLVVRNDLYFIAWTLCPDGLELCLTHKTKHPT